MVQMDDVAKIRKRWQEAGSPPCDHPDIDKEYYFGTSTGDYACLQCGKSAPWEAMRENRKVP